MCSVIYGFKPAKLRSLKSTGFVRKCHPGHGLAFTFIHLDITELTSREEEQHLIQHKADQTKSPQINLDLFGPVFQEQEASTWCRALRKPSQHALKRYNVNDTVDIEDL